MDQQRSLRIPISSSTGTDFVEVFPDEIPNDVNSLLDVLRAEYAPLKIWRAAALEYYHQNQLENFNEVLTEIVSAMNPEIEDYYRQRGEYEEGIVEIFDALAGYALYQSYSFVEDAQNSPEDTQKLEALKLEIVENSKKAEKVNPANEYTWMIRGFYELSYGDLAYAEHYLSSVYNRASKQNISQRVYYYGSTLGMGAVAYAKKKYSVALDFFVKAIQCNPLKCGNNVRVALATCCFKLGQYDRARSAVDRVLSLDPCNIDALLILSLLQRIDSGKVDAVKSKEFYRVARDLCNLVTQLDPSSALGLNQMANYKFDDWQIVDAKAVIKSPSMIEISHADLKKKSITILEGLQFEDMIRLKRGLIANVIQEVTTATNDNGDRVTTIVVKSDSEVPVDWVGRNAVLTSVKSKNDLNEVCRIAAKALRGSGVNEIRAESYYILGRVYHLLCQYDNAMKFYEDALLLMPEMALASFGIGQLYLAKEEFDLSYDNFQNVLKAYPDDRDTLAYIYFIKSYHRKETTTFEKLKDVASGFVFEADLWLSQGHAMHQKGPGEYAKSLKCYEMAYGAMKEQGLVPHNHVLLNMGVLYHAAGNLPKAMHYTLLSLEASDRPFRENELGEQIAVTPNVLFMETRNDIFYSWKIVPDLEVKAAEPPTSTPPIGKGGVSSLLEVVKGELSGISVGDYIVVDDVMLIVEDVVGNRIHCRGMISLWSAGASSSTYSVKKKTPRHNFNIDTIAHCFNLARIHEETGQTQAAIEVYTQLLKVHPSFLECYLRLSMIASNLGRKNDALMWIERGIALDKDNIDANVVFGDLYCQMESWELAKSKFEKICKERHQDTRSAISLGNLYFANIGPSSSIRNTSMKFFHVALKEDHRNVYAANGLGMICVKEGKHEAARNVFSRVREANVLPRSDDVVINMGHVHMQQGRFLEAIRVYESVLKSLPSVSCSSHVCQSSSNFIQPTVEPVLRYLPTTTHAAVSDSLSCALFKHKQYENAMRVQLKSLHMNPMQPHVWYNLAYTKESFAVSLLMKPHKTVPDIEFAMGELKEAKFLFSALTNENFCASAPKHKNYNPTKANEHAYYCNENVEKSLINLQRVKEEDDRRKEEREVFLIEQSNRAQEKERIRLQQIEEKTRANALRLEKANQKKDDMEKVWQLNVTEASISAAATSTSKGKKKKSAKSSTDDDNANGGGGDWLDKIDDDESGGEEQHGLFDSDEEDDDSAEKQKQAEVDKDKERAVFGSDSSDEEEEFNVMDTSDTAKAISGGRLKRPLNSDGDDDELDLSSGVDIDTTTNGDSNDKVGDVDDGSGVDGDGPARQRRKVIDDDDE